MLTFNFADLPQITVVYHGSEKSDVTVAEGDSFTLICKVGFRSNMASGTWPPTLIWYDYNHQDISSSNESASDFLVQRNASMIEATSDMDGRHFRCQMSFGDAPVGTLKSNTTTHSYSAHSPIYTVNVTQPLNLHCEYMHISHVLYITVWTKIQLSLKLSQKS